MKRRRIKGRKILFGIQRIEVRKRCWIVIDDEDKIIYGGTGTLTRSHATSLAKKNKSYKAIKVNIEHHNGELIFSSYGGKIYQ